MSVRTISCLSLSCFLIHAAPPRHNSAITTEAELTVQYARTPHTRAPSFDALRRCLTLLARYERRILRRSIGPNTWRLKSAIEVVVDSRLRGDIGLRILSRVKAARISLRWHVTRKCSFDCWNNCYFSSAFQEFYNVKPTFRATQSICRFRQDKGHNAKHPF